jgi:thiol-disulfide isomerase/thioredoxin
MSALFIASYAVLWVVVLALSVMILLLYRHFGLMAMSTAEGHERDGLALGSKASALSGVDARNVQHEWTPPLGNHSLLVFASPGCEPCEQIAPFLGQLGRSSVELLNRVVVVASGRGDAALALEKVTGGGALCLADDASGAAELYQTRVTPFGFVINPAGTVAAKGLLSNPGFLRNLLDRSGLSATAKELDGLVEHHLADQHQHPSEQLTLSQRS